MNNQDPWEVVASVSEKADQLNSTPFWVWPLLGLVLFILISMVIFIFWGHNK